jgi:hypothetical protein
VGEGSSALGWADLDGWAAGERGGVAGVPTSASFFCRKASCHLASTT